MLTKKIVGVLELASTYRYGITTRGSPMYLFKPYDETLPDYVVGSAERDTSVNQIALIDVVDGVTVVTETKPRGTLVRLIGPVGDLDAEENALLLHYCPSYHKPTKASITADTTGDETRVFLSKETGWRTFHIDPYGCRDVDDVVSINDGTGQWAITIADASAVVPVGTELDRIASAIGSTFYDLNGGVITPMLPPQISENIASLYCGNTENEPKRGVTMIYNGVGLSPVIPESIDTTWCLTWVTVDESYTYDSFPSSSIARQLGVKTEQQSHDFVETLMIRYNTAAGILLKKHGTGLLRSQAQADANEMANWDAIDPALGFLANEAAEYKAIDYSGPDSDSDYKHCGLGLNAYAHASSPLRRYADLYNQRIMKSIILKSPIHSENNQTNPEFATHLNERSRANRHFTRDLTFLTNVVAGSVHRINVIWVDVTRVWVPAWKRLIRIRHEPYVFLEPGSLGTIDIFCDPTHRCWKKRVLTSESNN